jgi:di/tricarboxylate transporter
VEARAAQRAYAGLYNRRAMGLDGWMTLAIIALAAFLLITERLRPDVTALLVLLSLSLLGILTPEQTLSGFSQSAVITILSMFILSHALERTGVTLWIGQRLLRTVGPHPRRLTAILMLAAAGLSTVMNSIAAAAVLVPSAVSIARQTRLPPSRLLMPLAFGALLGGTTTLLTTANILVNSSVVREGLRAFRLFEFFPVGIFVVLAGTATVTWLSPRLLGQRDVAGELTRMRRLHGELSRLYHLQEATSAVVLNPGSAMAGQTLRQGGWGEALGLTVLGVSHAGHVALAPGSSTVLEVGDMVLLEGSPSPEQLESYGLRLSFVGDMAGSLVSEGIPLVEVVLAPRSELEGKTLKEIHFREKYGMQVLALWRQGLVVQTAVADQPLRFGDAMLMQGPREKVILLRLDPNFLVLEEEAPARPGRRALLASAIMAGTLVIVAAGWLPIAVATLLGATTMVLTRCLTMDEAYRSIDWRSIFLIACMLPLSFAMDQTGAASFLAGIVQAMSGGLAPIATAASLMVVTIGLSLFLGGQTSAVVLAPIALKAAPLAAADPRALAAAVAIGCSLVFLSPLGHPANLLVMGPGSYTFRDYLRLGAPVTLVTVLVTLAGLHWIWGL